MHSRTLVFESAHPVEAQLIYVASSTVEQHPGFPQYKVQAVNLERP